MPEPMFLHIQSRGRTPARVVELPGDTVRIGRGSQCEIRLVEPTLAEVECLLRRRGNTWDIQPLGTSGRITIDGHPVPHARALVPGVPIRVGDHWLTVQNSPGRISGGFGSFETPLSGDLPIADPSALGSAVEPDRLSDRRYDDPMRVLPGQTTTESAATLAAKIREDHEARDRWHRNRREERLWEARWRSAGESLRSRDPNRPRPSQPLYPGAAVPDRPSWSPPPTRSPAPPPREVFAPRLLIDEPIDVYPDDELPPDVWGDESTTTPEVEQPAEPALLATFIESPTTAPVVPEPIDFPAPPPTVVDFAYPPEIPPTLLATAATATAPTTYHQDFATVREHAAMADTSTPEPVPASAATALLIPAPIPPKRPRGSRRADSSGSTRGAEASEPPLPTPEELDWPSARVILAMQPASSPRSSDRIRKTLSPRLAPRPQPTESAAPRQWTLPLWLAFFPATVIMLGLGVGGLGLASFWGQDDSQAGMLADRLLLRHAKSEDLSGVVDGMAPPAWWRTTAGHLALRWAALGDRAAEPEKQEKAEFFLGQARNSAPLEPSTRLALAGLESAHSTENPVSSLGMSRDVLALGWTGRQLVRMGRTEAALGVYRSALLLASAAELERATTPGFRREPPSRGFDLPNEDLVARIVHAMAASDSGKGSSATWSTTLPDHGLVLLVAYRSLLEVHDREADAILDRLAKLPDSPSFGPTPTHRAAKAEGLAAKGDLEQAARLYREAIDAMWDEAIRRTWNYNLAEILIKANDRDGSLDALNAARAGRGDDAIGRIAAAALTREGFAPKVPASNINSAPFRPK